MLWLCLWPMAAGGEEAKCLLLHGFDHACRLATLAPPTDTSPSYYTERDAREGCVGCRDLCTWAPDCLAYGCTSAGSRCRLWKRIPQSSSPQTGAECWVRAQGLVKAVHAQQQTGLSMLGGRPDQYAQPHDTTPSPPPSSPPPSPPMALRGAEQEQAFELLGRGEDVAQDAQEAGAMLLLLPLLLLPLLVATLAMLRRRAPIWHAYGMFTACLWHATCLDLVLTSSHGASQAQPRTAGPCRQHGLGRRGCGAR